MMCSLGIPTKKSAFQFSLKDLIVILYVPILSQLQESLCFRCFSFLLLSYFFFFFIVACRVSATVQFFNFRRAVVCITSPFLTVLQKQLSYTFF